MLYPSDFTDKAVVSKDEQKQPNKKPHFISIKRMKVETGTR